MTKPPDAGAASWNSLWNRYSSRYSKQPYSHPCASRPEAPPHDGLMGLSHLRKVWWEWRHLGFPMPAQLGAIVRDGGRS